MSVQLKPLLSPQEYLVWERQSSSKHEYFAGEVFAIPRRSRLRDCVAGASRRHVRITVNTVVALEGQLSDRPCEVFTSDMRVKVSASGLYTYPDIAVVCGKTRFDDAQEDTLINPTVLIEVLSKSTEAYDRGEKFAQYRTLESLTDYLLISQDLPRIEHYSRLPSGIWLFADHTGLESSLSIESIQCQLSLAAVYAKVDLSEATRTPRLVVVKEPTEFYSP
jgi:Uma2 family endonuclease